MARFLKKRTADIGQVPGEPVFIGKQQMERHRLRLIDYTAETLSEKELDDIMEGIRCRDTDTVTWINIDGVHDIELLKKIGNGFNLHPLVVEDIANTGQRPKMEEHDEYLFFVTKMLRFDSQKKQVIGEQLSLILGSNFLLTFQERVGDVFEPVRERIRKVKGRIRKEGTDYLAYALLDMVVDNYIVVIEHLGEKIEDTEEDILANPTSVTLEKINYYKREMNYIRKTVRPAREFILRLSTLDTNLIQGKTAPFLKDLLDHATQAVEVIDTYREMLSDYLNIYHSGVSNRLNEIMKVLTIFSVIFIPLTFIAGIYGTNFDYLPELHFRYSYFIFWIVLIVVALTMLRYFRQKKWL